MGGGKEEIGGHVEPSSKDEELGGACSYLRSTQREGEHDGSNQRRQLDIGYKGMERTEGENERQLCSRDKLHSVIDHTVPAREVHPRL